MKSWDETMIAASPLIAFLQKRSLFDAPYDGNTDGIMVVTDASDAFHFATDGSFDKFDEWETVSDSECEFPISFEWGNRTDSILRKKYNYFDLISKDFNGADNKWINAANGISCQLIELMLRDIRILFDCYANDYFPPLWKTILDVYLHNGFPCGWSGRYPEGKLVVFSNK
jgi:hypothetical protein